MCYQNKAHMTIAEQFPKIKFKQNGSCDNHIANVPYEEGLEFIKNLGLKQYASGAGGAYYASENPWYGKGVNDSSLVKPAIVAICDSTKRVFEWNLFVKQGTELPTKD